MTLQSLTIIIYYLDVGSIWEQLNARFGCAEISKEHLSHCLQDCVVQYCGTDAALGGGGRECEISAGGYVVHPICKGREGEEGREAKREEERGREGEEGREELREGGRERQREGRKKGEKRKEGEREKE